MPNPFNICPDKIFVYFRVSTQLQSTLTGGLTEQNKLCQKYISTYFNKHDVEYHSDIASSYNNKNKLVNLEKINNKIVPNSLILIRDISRLGRNSFQVFCFLRKIKKTNSHIISISDYLCYNYSKLMDKDFLHKVIDSEKSSDLKSIKIKNKLSFIKNNGGYLGKAPYGTQTIKFNDIPRLYKNEKEIEIIQLIRTKFTKLQNISKVCDYLKNKNILKRNSTDWTNYEIKKILKKHFPILLYNPKAIIDSTIYSQIPNYDTDKNDIFKNKNLLDNNYKKKEYILKKSKKYIKTEF